MRALVERRAQEAAAEAAALGVEPVRAVCGVVAPDGEVAAGDAQRGVQHFAVAQEAARVGAVALEQEGEVVAGPEFALQVELVAEDPDQVVGEGLGHATRQQGLEKGPLDPRLHQDQVLPVVARQRRVGRAELGAGGRRRWQGGVGPLGGGRWRRAPAPARAEVFPFDELLAFLDAGHPIRAGRGCAATTGRVGPGGGNELRQRVARLAHKEARVRRQRRGGRAAGSVAGRGVRGSAQRREGQAAGEQGQRAQSARNGVWQVPGDPQRQASSATFKTENGLCQSLELCGSVTALSSGACDLAFDTLRSQD